METEMSVPAVHEAAFVSEARELSSIPPEGPPEIAIGGRSNVGKSTLINRLAARHALARTSKTPGRTRGIITYDLKVQPPGGTPTALRFADLPGYGFAQVSRVERRGWGPLVEGFVKGRATLKMVLVLIDGRRGVDDEEKELLEWLVSLSVPHTIVATKIDKLSKSERGLLRDRLRAALGPGAAPVMPVSAQTGEGIDKLWRAILRAAAIS